MNITPTYFESFADAEASAVKFFNAEPAAVEMKLCIWNDLADKVQEWYASRPTAADPNEPLTRVTLRSFSMYADPISTDDKPQEYDTAGREVVATDHMGSPVYMPKVGDPATYSIGSDCYAYTVVSVSESGKTITARKDGAMPAEGHDYYGSQNWKYFSNPNARIEKFTLRNCGSYRPSGSTCGYLDIGFRRHYSDPHF